MRHGPMRFAKGSKYLANFVISVIVAGLGKAARVRARVEVLVWRHSVRCQAVNAVRRSSFSILKDSINRLSLTFD